MSSTSQPSTSAQHDSTEAFQLVQDLAAQLSSGKLRIPSLPEVVIRIRQTLEQEDYVLEELARLLSSEAILAGTILKLANSATYRRSSAETANMSAAISRIGASMVRSASMNFAMQQLRNADQFKNIEHLLSPEWQHGKAVAGLSHSLSRSTGRGHPDEMLMLGLTHNVGRIFILSHAEHYPLTFSSAAAVNDLMHRWHPAIGSAIAESWNLPETAVQAIGQQHQPDDEQDHQHDVSDVLQTAIALHAIDADCDDEDAALAALLELPSASRLGLDAAILRDARTQAAQWIELLA
jgi:HD-like signal output (HDOD) protein